MKKFRFTVSSWLNFIFTISCASIAATYALPIVENSVLRFILYILIVGSGFYLTRYTARASTLWTISENDLQLKWLKQFPFKRNRDLIIKWSEIVAYKYQQDRTFDLFKLCLNDGRMVKVWHLTTITSDDFEKFINSFEKKVQLYNERQTTTQSIERAKTSYETKFGAYLAMFLASAIIGIVALYVIFPNRGHIRWGSIAVASAGVGFCIFQVLVARRKQSSS
jgi:hypothetical protein